MYLKKSLFVFRHRCSGFSMGLVPFLKAGDLLAGGLARHFSLDWFLVFILFFL